ncbi:MAG TPA: isochorismatase family protein [Candidatus Rubrimentiphilum sp.]|nr:isochorismatase family protein [Candidatus Rubrimentiphilum sp.]
MQTIGAGDALIVVDVQNDFLPGGALPVAQGNRIFGPLERIMPLFPYVVATRDWHPREHPHFKDYGGTWPYHCLQHTYGAGFAPKMNLAYVDEILSKGSMPPWHGYSAFENSDLAERLRARGVQRIFVAGLATDYCVKETALAAAQSGFETLVVSDAIAPVAVRPQDETQAIEEMEKAGVRFVTSSELRTAA